MFHETMTENKSAHWRWGISFWWFLPTYLVTCKPEQVWSKSRNDSTSTLRAAIFATVMPTPCVPWSKNRWNALASNHPKILPKTERSNLKKNTLMLQSPFTQQAFLGSILVLKTPPLETDPLRNALPNRKLIATMIFHPHRAAMSRVFPYRQLLLHIIIGYANQRLQRSIMQQNQHESSVVIGNQLDSHIALAIPCVMDKQLRYCEYYTTLW